MENNKNESERADAVETIAHTHFKAMRRALKVALLLGILVPAAYVAAFGAQDWRDRYQAAAEATERSTFIAEEHALKVFDIDAAIADRVIADVSDRRSTELANDQTLHGTLEHLVHGYAQITALSVFDKGGGLKASSRWFPSPKVDIGDRQDFLEARASAPRLYISGPMRGRVSNQPTFNVMQAAVTEPDRAFDGVVSIAMSPTYFEGFYQQLADNNPMTIGLIRRDGSILAWYPGSTPRPSKIAADTPFYGLLNGGSEHAVITMRSTIDGETKILAFRRVGRYDAYVTAGYPLRAIREAWLVRFSTLALATAIPTMSLFLLLLFSLRRLDREESLWRRAKDESSMRAALQIAARENQHLESLGNLVALVAHDFNNLLMAIVGYARAALEADPGARNGHLAGVQAAAERGKTLTRKLLSVARKQPMRVEAFDATRWAATFELLRSVASEGILLDTLLEQGVWTIEVDHAELELALLNMAINACEAMRGRGRLTVNVTNEAGSSLDFVRIAMTDTGSGVSPDVASRAFEPFFTTKPPGQGAGLGLAQVQSFCEMSGGRCSIKAAPAGGTRVTLLLPRASGPVSARRRAEEVRKSGIEAAGISLLLVEDDQMVADAQVAMFSAMGYEVAHVSTADDALAVLAPAHSYQVVISDVQMPGTMTGLDLAEYLQREQPDLPLMLLTGFVEHAERLRQLGITSFLKPVDVDVLDEWIRRRVGRRE